MSQGSVGETLGLNTSPFELRNTGLLEERDQNLQEAGNHSPAAGFLLDCLEEMRRVVLQSGLSGDHVYIRNEDLAAYVNRRLGVSWCDAEVIKRISFSSREGCPIAPYDHAILAYRLIEEMRAGTFNTTLMRLAERPELPEGDRCGVVELRQLSRAQLCYLGHDARRNFREHVLEFLADVAVDSTRDLRLRRHAEEYCAVMSLYDGFPEGLRWGRRMNELVLDFLGSVYGVELRSESLRLSQTLDLLMLDGLLNLKGYREIAEEINEVIAANAQETEEAVNFYVDAATITYWRGLLFGELDSAGT